jgi:hypothetical protein
MKKHFAKTISILSLIVMLSVGASNVSAFPITTPWLTDSGYRTRPLVSANNVSAFGGGCTTCKPLAPYAMSESAQNATQPEYSFSLSFFLAQLAMSLPYLP